MIELSDSNWPQLIVYFILFINMLQWLYINY